MVGPWFASDDPNEDIKEEDHEDDGDDGAMKVTVEEDFSTVPTQVKNS